MKKNRIFSALMAAALLTSCAQFSSSAAIKELDKETVSNMPKKITISCEDAFDDSYGATDQGALDDWCSYMSEKYGTTVLVKTTYGNTQRDGFTDRLASGGDGWHGLPSVKRVQNDGH